ncbi:hypothetical protein WMW72_28530 [Paenibacillus filicis]|uniref:Uncharacterized protein n=1 Tax=Paenibacillus filicis TaxID=669464 RepID=A0ABU9DSL6_9BACL
MRNSYVWALASGLMLLPSVAQAAYPSPPAISLQRETPAYESPCVCGKPVLGISPQLIYITDSLVPPENAATNWYKVATWQGQKWIQLQESDWTGQQEPDNSLLVLLRSAALYDEPRLSAKREDAIVAQTVRVQARVGEYFQIDTWLGPKWIRHSDAMLFDVQAVDEPLVLQSATAVFELPDAASRQVTELSPQTVQAFERSGAWVHIQTWLGPMWVNPAIAQPAAAVPAEATIELTRPVKLFRYPTFESRSLGTLAPQSVQVFERSGGWVRIHSEWMGDVWLYPMQPAGSYQEPDPVIPVIVTGGWNSTIREIGGIGGREAPLSVELGFQGFSYDPEAQKMLLKAGDTLSLDAHLFNVTQNKLELTTPVSLRIEIGRVTGTDIKPVWQAALPVFTEKLLPAYTLISTDEKISWQQTDSQGLTLPEGDYELRLLPLAPVTYFAEGLEGTKENPKEAELRNHYTRMPFRISAP